MEKKIINGNLKWVLGFILDVAGATIPGIIAYGTISEKVARIEIDINTKISKEISTQRYEYILQGLVEAKIERQAIMKKLDEIK